MSVLLPGHLVLHPSKTTATTAVFASPRDYLQLTRIISTHKNTHTNTSTGTKCNRLFADLKSAHFKNFTNFIHNIWHIPAYK